MRLASLFGTLLLFVLPTSAGCSSAPDAIPPSRAVAGDDDDEAEARGDGRTPPGQPDDPQTPAPAGATKIGSALIVDLGAVSAGKSVTLDVPSNALGFNVVVEGGSVGIARITSPSGAVVHDAHMPKNGSFPTSESIDGAASASVPQSDVTGALPIAPGKWTIAFAGSGAGKATARVQTTSDGKFHGGALDLVIHVPVGLRMSSPSPSHVVDPAKASTDRDIVARVDRFFVALDRAFGIGRGAVSFKAAPAALVRIATDAAITQAASVAKDAPDAQALHIVLTNAIGEGEGDLLGLSPGIPGAAIRPGTSMSALMVAHYDDTNVESEALTWLHEMGHFVGLQHTTEYDGSAFDPLSDTPKCTGGTRNPTRCPDNGNLMFTGSFPAAPILSAAQKAVLRGSPIYRAYADDAAKAAAAPTAAASAELAELAELATAPLAHRHRCSGRWTR
ncbi:MAG: hypothetical protein KF819_33755 [Labilithrix sp.]|nr:hypothetical protein [Labilithrix sp.]